LPVNRFGGWRMPDRGRATVADLSPASVSRDGTARGRAVCPHRIRRRGGHGPNHHAFPGRGSTAPSRFRSAPTRSGLLQTIPMPSAIVMLRIPARTCPLLLVRWY